MNYYKETKKIINQLKRKSMKNFYKYYVLGEDAPHYHIPYKDVVMTKFPCDLFIYKDIVHKNKPDAIVEIGSGRGGSAVFFSDIFDGAIYTFDKNIPKFKDHFNNRIKSYQMDVTKPENLKKIGELIEGKKCLIIDDASHFRDDVYIVFKELNKYVPSGGFYIVEDGVVSMILGRKPNRDPCLAIDRILKEYEDFELYTDYDFFIFSTVHRGILRKK